jgi:hypothetical protein
MSMLYKFIEMISIFWEWFWHRTMIGFVTAILIGTIGFIWVILWANNQVRADNNHREFLRRQDICRAQDAWYEQADNYYNLIACHRLDTHELFYVVPETGLALVPAE